MRVIALIRKGISVEQANARLEQFARSLAQDHGSTNPEYQGMDLTTWNIKEAVIGGARPVLLILLGAVGVIVAISCANIGNLLLSRASGRRREMAVRTALGAPRRRILRQLLTESLLLSLAGGALGALLAAWGVPAAVAVVGQTQLPGSGETRLDGGALALALGVSLVMGIVFGLAPAAHAARGDLVRAIREGGLQSGTAREVRRTRGALVVAQIALAMVVLSAAGLMVRTYRELLRLDVGYNTHQAVTAQIELPVQKYPNGETVIAFYRALMERLGSSAGIDGAAVATGRPLIDRVVDLSTQDFSLVAREGEKSPDNANVRVVTSGYFQVAGVRLIRGRRFNDTDTTQTEPVAIINQTMAALYWPHQDPVGQSIRMGTYYGNGAGSAPAPVLERDTSSGRWVKIVGVVSDARQVRVVEVPVRQEIFFPVAQRPELARTVTLFVRSPLATDALSTTLRRAVAAIDPDRPIFEVITLEQAVNESFATKRLATVLLGFFAVVALALATVGLYAIMAYSIAQRRREIGIHIALGARPRDVLRLTMGEGWRLAASGLSAGIVAALLLTRLMQSIVFDVSTNDPLTFTITAAVLAAVALLASYFPARSATRVDPIIALRYE
jgi:putative ABC transport system permease protein